MSAIGWVKFHGPGDVCRGFLPFAMTGTAFRPLPESGNMGGLHLIKRRQRLFPQFVRFVAKRTCLFFEDGSWQGHSFIL